MIKFLYFKSRIFSFLTCYKFNKPFLWKEDDYVHNPQKIIFKCQSSDDGVILDGGIILVYVGREVISERPSAQVK